MADKLLSQGEVNRIVATRLRRERDRLSRDFENSLNRCMAAVQLTLQQELLAIKTAMAAETMGPLWPDMTEEQLPCLTCRTAILWKNQSL